MSKIERYVPLGASSISSDAPGWNTSSITTDFSIKPTPNPSSSSSSTSVCNGPVCWKCKGSGRVKTNHKKKRKRKNKKEEDTKQDVPQSTKKRNTIVDGHVNKGEKNKQPCDVVYDQNTTSSVSTKSVCTVCNGRGTLKINPITTTQKES